MDDQFRLLPEELLGEVLSFYSPNELCIARLVCKSWLHNVTAEFDRRLLPPPTPPPHLVSTIRLVLYTLRETATTLGTGLK
jgi:hypothetical protein